MEMLAEVVGGFPNVEVGAFDGLLVDYAAQSGASVILRAFARVGLRIRIADGAHESPAAAGD